MANNYLIKGDSKEILKNLSNNSIHLVVTSPPYFNAREYSQWEKLDDYLNDMRNIFKEIFRILNNHRVFVLNVGDVQCKLGAQPWTLRRIPLGALFTTMCQEIGFEYVDNYIWDKGEPQSYRHMNGVTKFPFYQYPINSYEHILIFHKHILDQTRLPCPVCGSPHVQNNSQSEIGVQSWECNNENCIERSEGNRGKRFSARSIMMQKGQKEENIIEENLKKKWRKDIVSFSPVIKIFGDKNIAGHTAPFPEDIPEMAIKFYSYKGDTILDPFAGSFTTSLVAMKNGRHSIGIEVMPEYVKIGEKRLRNYTKQTRLDNNEKHDIILLDKKNLDRIKIQKSKVFDKENYIRTKQKRGVTPINQTDLQNLSISQSL
ncbi:site-specific DNA-methyltransferase [Candidatus Pacearchaeota archaeon]|nr:site-specific DNA-methyltransferase [Candidatus Pacearchaeota archaeon]